MLYAFIDVENDQGEERSILVLLNLPNRKLMIPDVEDGLFVGSQFAQLRDSIFAKLDAVDSGYVPPQPPTTAMQSIRDVTSNVDNLTQQAMANNRKVGHNAL